MHQCTDRLTIHNLLKVANNVHVEHVDRQVVLLAHCCCCEVHNLKATSINLVVCYVGKLGCCWVLLWVGCIDTVNTCTLKHNVSLDLYTAQ